MRFSPKILGLNVGMFGLFSSSQDYVWRLVLIPRLVSSGFVVYLEFGAVFSQILEVKNGLNWDWFRGC